MDIPVLADREKLILISSVWTLDDLLRKIGVNEKKIIYIYISKVKLATIVEGNPKAPFSIATTPRCRGGRYSFPGWLYFTLDPHLIIFTNPSARAGYDTRSIFKRSLTGLYSEFSFS